MVHAQTRIPKNFMRLILWDFEIQTDHLIPARRPYRVKINKKTPENLPSCGFCRPGGPQSENQKKRKEGEVLEPRKRTRKAMGYEAEDIVIEFDREKCVMLVMEKGKRERMEENYKIRKASEDLE